VAVAEDKLKAPAETCGDALTSPERLQSEVIFLRRSLKEAESREALLQQKLMHERDFTGEFDEDTTDVQPLSPSSLTGKEGMRQELSSLSNMLEQREEDILNIKFDMVELQCRLGDQARLVSENADAFQTASEELADKDEKLHDALARQEELLAEMNAVSSKLQQKVEQLSQELEGSRAAYQTLDEQTRAVVSGLESERDNLQSELTRVRNEAAEVASLRLEMQNARTAAEEARAQAKQESERAAELMAKLVEVQQQVKSLDRGVAVKHDEAQQREAELQEAVRLECQKTRKVEDQLSTVNERFALAETQIKDLSSALERAQFIERQAVERAQEYRTSLELFKEFRNEDFMQEEMFPSPRVEELRLDQAVDPASPGSAEKKLSSVLVSVDLDLGFSTATLAIAPWQTRADFDSVVNEFLEEHGVKPMFADALVKYLEEVEANAVTFPVHVSATLVDVYQRFS
jgi:myosin heavy subunit